MVCTHESLDNTTEFTPYCAPGTTISIRNVEVHPQVTLRVIIFSPSSASDKPKILFIPGWISHIESWKAVLLEMTRFHEVIYFETREKVSSIVGKKAAFTIQDIGEDIIHFVQAEFKKNDQYVIFASSLGATLALETCQQLKPAPLSMALVAPNAVFRVPWFMKLFVFATHPDLYLIARPIIKKYLKHFRLSTQHDMAQYQKYCRALDNAEPRKLKKAAIAFWNYSVWHRLPEIHTPTLIIGASKDKLHEPENLIRIADTLPNATYIDLGTNAAAHEADAVHALHNFLNDL